MRLKNIGVDDCNIEGEEIEVFLCNSDGKQVSLVFESNQQLKEFIKELKYIKNNTDRI